MADLTNKQKAFVEQYLQDFNATKAAQRAGYGGDDATLAVTGHRVLRKAKVAERISQRLREAAMSADEVLSRLAEIGRAEYSQYINTDGAVDLARLLEDGKGHLVKGIKETKYGQQVEFYDSQKALVDIGRHHALFTDKADVTSGGEPLAPVIFLPAIEKEDDEGE